MRQKPIPNPARLRKIKGTFAWIDHRLLRHGLLQTLSLQDIAVYLFLVLAADKDGISFYRIDKIGHQLGLDIPAVLNARDRLMQRELIAFQPFSPGEINGFYQVLDLENVHPKIVLWQPIKQGGG